MFLRASMALRICWTILRSVSGPCKNLKLPLTPQSSHEVKCFTYSDDRPLTSPMKATKKLFFCQNPTFCSAHKFDQYWDAHNQQQEERKVNCTCNFVQGSPLDYIPLIPGTRLTQRSITWPNRTNTNFSSSLQWANRNKTTCSMIVQQDKEILVQALFYGKLSHDVSYSQWQQRQDSH